MVQGQGYLYILIIQIIFFVVVTALIYFIIKNRNQNLNNPNEILNKRLASGEITTKEFKKLKGIIKKQ